MHGTKSAQARGSPGPVERIGSIAEVIAAASAKNEALGQLTPEVVDKLHEQRLFRLLLPRDYGGEEVDLATWFRAMEALAKLDASTAWCVGQINGCAATACAVEPGLAREIWGEPRAALSWGPPVKARAEEVEGGHRLSGEWMLSSGSRHATWVGLHGAGVRQGRQSGRASRRRANANLLRAGQARSSGSTTGTWSGSPRPTAAASR